MRNGIGPMLGRVFGVVAGLMLLGIMLRLVTALLTPVLPAPLMQMLTSGWQLRAGVPTSTRQHQATDQPGAVREAVHRRGRQCREDRAD
jgi:hypothetical protein